ncbi:MAG: hypothetical protein KBA26_11680 [Candidatus Delongbacteria bacterium]|nr:hypothetical protein [Candidatus Delongbacteria bacterium]
MNCPVCGYDIKPGELQGKTNCPECNSTLSPDFIQSLEGIMASTDEKDNLVELDEEIVESKAHGKSNNNMASIIIIVLLVVMIVAAVLYYLLVIARKPSSLPVVADTTIVDLSDSLNIIDTTSYTDSLVVDTASSITVSDSMPQDTLARDSLRSDSVSMDDASLPPPEIMDTVPPQRVEPPSPTSTRVGKKAKPRPNRRIPTPKDTPPSAQPSQPIPPEPEPTLSVETTQVVPPVSQLIRSVMVTVSNSIVITDRVKFDRDQVRYMAFSAQGMKSLPFDRILRIEFIYDGPINFSDQSGLYLVRANITTRNGETYKNVVIPELSFHTSQQQKYLIKDRFIRTRSINSVTRITLLE